MPSRTSRSTKSSISPRRSRFTPSNLGRTSRRAGVRDHWYRKPRADGPAAPMCVSNGDGWDPDARTRKAGNAMLAASHRGQLSPTAFRYWTRAPRRPTVAARCRGYRFWAAAQCSVPMRIHRRAGADRPCYFEFDLARSEQVASDWPFLRDPGDRCEGDLLKRYRASRRQLAILFSASEPSERPDVAQVANPTNGRNKPNDRAILAP